MNVLKDWKIIGTDVYKRQVLMMTITGKWSDELKYNLMKYGNNK